MKNELTNRNGFYPDYDFFDEAMHDFFPAFYGKGRHQKYMRTDITETDDAYQMEVELPGLDKQDIHIDLIAVSRQGLIDGVVHDFIHQVMQAPGACGADIHTRTLPDGLQSLQDLNLAFVILLVGLRHIAEIQM